jgi:hypothetical protein
MKYAPAANHTDDEDFSSEIQCEQLLTRMNDESAKRQETERAVRHGERSLTRRIQAFHLSEIGAKG